MARGCWKMRGSTLVKVCMALCCLFLPTLSLNAKLYGLNYDLRRAPDWFDDRCKPEVLIRRELELVHAITPRLRIYTMYDCYVSSTLKQAAQLNMSYWLGLWVDDTRVRFNDEILRLEKYIKEKVINATLLEGVNVGSETLYRNETTAKELVEMAKRTKKLLKEYGMDKVPVSITETPDVLLENPEIIEVSDVVTVNQFPFWSKVPIEKAMAELKKSMNQLRNAGKKEIIITETGWPTGGVSRDASEATPESAAKYLKEFFKLAEDQNWKYYYFSSFDAGFRGAMEGEPNSVEDHFGVFTKNGTLKPAYENITIQGTRMRDGPTLPIPQVNRSRPSIDSNRAPSSVLSTYSLAVAAFVVLLSSL